MLWIGLGFLWVATLVTAYGMGFAKAAEIAERQCKPGGEWT